MKRFPISIPVGAAVLLGMVGFQGRTMLAARQNATTSGPVTLRQGASARPSGTARPGGTARQHVRVVKGTPPTQTASLVVPLGRRRATEGQLQILNKQGEPAGLCPLKHTDVTADVAGFVARVNVVQQFHNPSSEPVEAVYTFPLPDDAAVDAMEMRIGNRLVQGEIKRREEARQIYEVAKAAGQAAALLDQERANIFTQSVANIMPNSDVTIKISYVNTLKYDEGRYEFSFPMVVGPRFVPVGGYTEPGKRGEPAPAQEITGDPGTTSVVTDPEKITPPIAPPGTRAGHDISITVKLDAGLPIQDISSVLHDVDVVQPSDSRATIRLKDAATIPNKDFILRYGVAGKQVQSAVLTHSDGAGNGYFTLILQPPAAPPQAMIAPKEMVFVIDTTGSQMGAPLEKSKETMRYAIQHMNPGDTFQVLSFTTNVVPCFPNAVPASAENVRKALAFLDALQGGGGTDILKAANYAVKLPVDKKRLRIICFMTDGYVGNDMQILGFVKAHRNDARMFPFGIGNSVNRFLIEGMAREGRGAADIVTLEEDGKVIASRFQRRIANPVLLNPTVSWNGLPVQDIYPTQIPDVFSSGPIIIKGRYTHAAEGDITLRGIVGGRPWEQRVHVSLPEVRADGEALESLWARARIEDLQAQDWVGGQTGHPLPNIKDDIIETALAHRLMSQFTSFVAVEKQVINIGGKQRTVDVPVEMPEGVEYKGIFGQDKDTGSVNGTLYGATAYYNYAAPTAARSAGLPLMSLSPPPAPPASPAPHAMRKVARPSGTAAGSGLAIANPPGPAESPNTSSSTVNGDLLTTEAGRERLADMKPEERRATLEQLKLAPELRGLAAKVKKDGTNGTLHKKGLPDVENGRVQVQVWLTDPPADMDAKLKSLGFTVEATLRPGKLLIGTVSMDKLDALIELAFVRRVEVPKLT